MILNNKPFKIITWFGLGMVVKLSKPRSVCVILPPNRDLEYLTSFNILFAGLLYQ